MMLIVEFNPMTHNRMPTGRYCRLEGSRATLRGQLAMMGITLPLSNKWILGYKLFVYQNNIPVGSDWVETPLSELVN